MLKNFFLKHKKTIYITIFILIIIFLSFLPKQKSAPEAPPDPSETQTQSQTQYIPPFYTQPLDTNSPAVETAIQTKQNLKPNLPIYIKDFQTSVNITTTINLYILSSDPDYLIHFDIYGIDYQNQDVNEKTNPNVTAFKESFLYAKKQLESQNIDLRDLYFIFGGRQFIQQTAEIWINQLNLL